MKLDVFQIYDLIERVLKNSKSTRIVWNSGEGTYLKSFIVFLVIS